MIYLNPNGPSSWHGTDKFEIFSYYLAAILLMHLQIIAFIHLKKIFYKKNGSNPSLGASLIFFKRPPPHFYPLIFGPLCWPLSDLQKAYIPLCSQWKRNLKGNRMHINMFTIVWFYSSKTFCEISVPYVLDKSLISLHSEI